MQMLDLSVFQEHTVDIKMTDGTILSLKKPSQKMYIKFLDYSNKIHDKQDTGEVFDEINTIVHMILNNNDNGTTVDLNTVKKLSMDMKTAIINYYMQFINEILSGKN